ncbi:unnamed protein product [Paramecium sonneborni]|uniref:Uncharacterized protein n=1 Tax=Paramecium sonneborni TaxID=65129 RepID=A0A8S1L089_9CILI|nr:unnamed protein product [Paramecium sonneborni]
MSLGIGAFKFQTIISHEIKTTRDPGHKSRIRSQSRKSIQEKCMLQLQNSKKKLKQKPIDIENKYKQQTEQNQEEFDESLLNEISIFDNKKQEKKNFILQVSEPSNSDSSFSDVGFENFQDNKINNQIKQENLKKSLLCQRLNNLTVTFNQPQSSQLFLQQGKVKSKIISTKQRNQKILNPSQFKKDIQLLGSLKQNQEFNENQAIIVEEYKLNKEIYIDIDCQEIKTFMRLQNEVEEMRRKQMDFNIQKERHYEIVNDKSNKQILRNQRKSEENKLWSVIMAKNFIKNLKLKKETNNRTSSQQSEGDLIKKMMRVTQIK